jgi:hypothetical protein
MRTTFDKNVSLKNKLFKSKDQAKKLQKSVKDLTFESMRPRLELPFMYSNITFTLE